MATRWNTDRVMDTFNLPKVAASCLRRAVQGTVQWQRRWHRTQPAALDIEDTLKVAALIHSFRNDGHLAAALDPLHRVKQGPWLADSRQATTWYAILNMFGNQNFSG